MIRDSPNFPPVIGLAFGFVFLLLYHAVDYSISYVLVGLLYLGVFDEPAYEIP